MPTSLTLIVAIARNGVIGRDGKLPWRLPSDMKRFVARTMGKPVLMGRRTWASLQRRPLPGRQNLVLTRDADFIAGGAWVYADLSAMLAAGRAMATASGVEEVCVIGGAQLFRATLPLADRIVLTEVNLAPEGNTRLDLDLAGWREISREDVAAGAKDDADFAVRVLEEGSSIALLPNTGGAHEL
ncbi:MAG: dihydrofolate reductase [Vitreimonas sp.]